MDLTALTYLLNDLRSLPKENEWVEFKSSNSDPQEIGEYISALSNSALLHGQKNAYLVWGIENDTHNIIGTTVSLKMQKVGNQEIENWLATQLEPRVDFSFFEFGIDGKNIVLLLIDAASSRPVSFKEVKYIRVGSYKKKLVDHPEKERKIWEKARHLVFETDFAKRSVSKDEVLRFIDYPSYFELMKQNLPENRDAIIGKLKEEKILFQEGESFHITNLGAILFAKNLQNFDDLSRKAFRVIQYEGKDRLSTIKEHLELKGYAVGFNSLVDYINDRLPQNEEIGRAFRKEVKMYPEIAIRELVANALIHQDFSERGMGPMLEIFKDRIEITNPGKPLISTLRFIDHSPQSRNEKLASFMRRLNLCEERGSGIDKVITAIELNQLPAPKFQEEEKYTRVYLYASKFFKDMDKLDRIRACYQHCCLKYVVGEMMTNQTLRKRLKIDEKNYSMVSRVIKEATEKNLIKPYDINAGTKSIRYIPNWA